MKKIFGITAIFTALMILVSCAEKPDENGWYNDYNSALKAAKKGKSVLLFVNSDYDVENSQNGVNAILSKEFTDALSDKYSFIHFDFTDMKSALGSSDKEISSKEQKALEKRRARMQKQFIIADNLAVQTTPAMYILSSDGYFISDVTYEYSKDSAAGYAGFVKVEDSNVEEFNALVQKTKTGSKADRLAAIDEIFERTSEVHRTTIIDLCKKYIALDKKDETKQVSKYLFTIANAESYSKITVYDFEGAAKIYEKYATDSRLLPEDSQVLYYLAASALSKTNPSTVDSITALLQKALDAAPESENVPTIKAIMSQIIQTVESQNATQENAEESESTESNE